MKKLKYILIGIICLLVLILIVNLYLYWKSTVNDNHGYNSINALIALLALLVNIITIFFLYFNYQQQQKHINKQEEELKNNKQDTEFNRALDIIYRQLEYTNKRYRPVNKPIQLSNYLHLIVNATTQQSDERVKIFKKHSEDIQSFFKFFNLEFEIYKDVLNVDSLTIESKLKLINIITWNIGIRFKTDVLKFMELYNEWINKEKPEGEIYNKIVKKMVKINEFFNGEF